MRDIVEPGKPEQLLRLEEVDAEQALRKKADGESA